MTDPRVKYLEKWNLKGPNGRAFTFTNCGSWGRAVEMGALHAARKNAKVRVCRLDTQDELGDIESVYGFIPQCHTAGHAFAFGPPDRTWYEDEGGSQVRVVTIAWSEGNAYARPEGP